MALAIAANLIVLNEAQRLARCLHSLQWVDEIVVVDGGSHDGTVELARAHGARVVVHPFRSFAQQRNIARQLTRCPWILSVDADEVVTDALRHEICSLGRESERFAAFRIPIHSWIFGRRFRWSGTRNESKLRLFRRDRVCWVGRVHERLRVAGPVGELGRPIRHYSTETVEDWFRKAERYVALGRRSGNAALGFLAMLGRRLVWQGGVLDGPQGIAFGLLSAWEEWLKRCDGHPEAVATDGWPHFLLRIARRLAESGRRRGPTVRVSSTCPACRSARCAA